MEKYKQLIIDVLVVCAVPIVIILAYRLFFVDGELATDGLLSVDSISLGVASPGDAGTLGAKSKEILNQLDSIKFDATFFEDPTFLSLRDLTPVYLSTSTGREYPFSTPEEVRILLERVKSANPSASPIKSTTTSPRTTKTTTSKAP